MVIGGSGNTVNHDYAGIFGNGLTSAASNTFHINCLNAINTPNAPLGVGVPLGTIYWDAVGAPGKALYIK